jgi:hypothetical protein
MLRQIHEVLVQRDVTRKCERRMTRWLKNGLGVPDAFGDARDII